MSHRRPTVSANPRPSHFELAPRSSSSLFVVLVADLSQDFHWCTPPGSPLVADAGFVVEGQDEAPLTDARRDLVTLRRRLGPGTAIPANG
jgi:hypothetical protein